MHQQGTYTTVYGCSVSRNFKLIIAALASAAVASLVTVYLRSQSPKKEDNKKAKSRKEKFKKQEEEEKREVHFSVESQRTEMANKPSCTAVVRNEAKSSSWTDLVEDDERRQIYVKDSKLPSELEVLDVSNNKSVPSNSGDCDLFRGSNDSGVVSPNENGQVLASTSQRSPSTFVSAKTESAETPNKRRTESGESPDGGLGSSVCGEEALTHCSYHEELTRPENKTLVNGQRQQNGSDSGQGSEADDGIKVAYHFYIPTYLCGKFIGMGGNNVKQIKAATKCAIQLRELDENGFFKAFHLQNRHKEKRTNSSKSGVNQVCIIEGTRNGIDHCLDLIRKKFPIDQFPDVTLEQINLPNCWQQDQALFLGEQFSDVSGNQQELTSQPLQLGLVQGEMHEVYVSNIVCGGHVFLQQPTHPTHSSLPRLERCMVNTYTKLPCPDIPREVIEPGLVCVAKFNYQWYRVQIVKYETTCDTCDVKFVDYGGFYNFPVADLKQIRSDFLTLPFQALECYLGNVVPPDNAMEWPAETGVVLSEMVSDQIISGRMLGVNDDLVPIVHLYGWVNVSSESGTNDVTAHEQQPRLLNRELVDRGVAQWTEHVVAS